MYKHQPTTIKEKQVKARVSLGNSFSFGFLSAGVGWEGEGGVIEIIIATSQQHLPM